MVAKHRRLGLLLALGVAMSCPTPARAWTEFLSMDVLPENAGWQITADAGAASSSIVSGGILTLNAGWFREYRSTATWTGTVSAATGYTIEFRLRVVMKCQCTYSGTDLGVMYNDNTTLTGLSIDPGRIGFSYPDYGPWISLDATVWHTYRIVVLGNHHQVFVDDVLTLDYEHPGYGAGTRDIAFGDMGACGGGTTVCPSQSEWDYFAYETGAVVPAAPTTWGRLKTLYRAERWAAQPASQGR